MGYGVSLAGVIILTDLFWHINIISVILNKRCCINGIIYIQKLKVLYYIAQKFFCFQICINCRTCKQLPCYCVKDVCGSVAIATVSLFMMCDVTGWRWWRWIRWWRLGQWVWDSISYTGDWVVSVYTCCYCLLLFWSTSLLWWHEYGAIILLICVWQAEKRAHHNALERKRRDHIKDSFHGLRDAIPTLQGEKVSAW